MSLFKALTQLEEQSSSMSSSHSIKVSQSTPAFPPTAIQLYSSKYIHFNTNTIHHLNKNVVHSSSKNNDGTTTYQEQNDKSQFSSSSSSSSVLPNEYEILSYQPVYVPDAITGAANTKTTANLQQDTSTNNNALAVNFVPNLGVWDCRFYDNNTNNDNTAVPLLKSALYQYRGNIMKPTFILNIDLDSIENVHSTLSNMMLSILQSMYQMNKMKEQKEKEQLKQTNVENEEKTNVETEPVPSSSIFKSLLQFGTSPSTYNHDIFHEQKMTFIDLLDQMNIIICAILPSLSENKTMTYKEKQGLNLVLYHLFKYSNEMNCTLCFVNQKNGIDETMNNDDIGRSSNIDNNDENITGETGNESSNDTFGIIPKGLSVHQFAQVIKAICTDDHNENSNDSKETTYKSLLGFQTNEIDEEDINGNDNSKEQSSSSSSIYFPNGYDVDLIDSLYLRSASCAGVWDANTDNLWDALPPPSSSSNETPITPSNHGRIKKLHNDEEGEEEWLSKLAETVSAYTNTSFGVGSSSSNTSMDGSKTMNGDDNTSRSTKVKDSSTVVTAKTKRPVRKKAAGTSSKKPEGKDNVSDFFNDLLKS